MRKILLVAKYIDDRNGGSDMRVDFGNGKILIVPKSAISSQSKARLVKRPAKEGK